MDADIPADSTANALEKDVEPSPPTPREYRNPPVFSCELKVYGQISKDEFEARVPDWIKQTLVLQ